ncbi:MAG: DUF3592 domain-containing protein [Candidatus Woesearchaeota archaeon]|nr:DUF3592 domain-containing protein [Candidatus Woesearchaeota archaeon]
MDVKWIIAIMFIGVGLIFSSVGGLFLYSDMMLKKSGVHAEGIVVELLFDGSVYKPLVRFIDQEGEEIEFFDRTGTNPSMFMIGDKVEVYYESDNPYTARLAGSWNIFYFSFIIGGLLFAIVGFFLQYGFIMQDKEYLKKKGIKIHSEFLRVEKNEGFKVDGESPFRIVSRAKSGGVYYTFYSKNLWVDPSDKIKDKIAVYVDSRDMSKYYVDLSELNI